MKTEEIKNKNDRKKEEDKVAEKMFKKARLFSA